jgi:Fe-Mn family superoxide dismutase
MSYEVKPLPYAYDALKGISEQVNRWHHDTHYAGYVKGRNEVEEKLAAMRNSGDYSAVRGVKLNESHNASGQILHEIYYDIMGGNGEIDENLEVVAKIKEDFGSLDIWLAEFKAVAKASRGWCITCFDYKSGKLHNFLVDFQDLHAVWGATPLIPVDMWEHAYYPDQGPNKDPYLDAFLSNLDWSKINDLYLKTQK